MENASFARRSTRAHINYLLTIKLKAHSLIIFSLVNKLCLKSLKIMKVTRLCGYVVGEKTIDKTHFFIQNSKKQTGTNVKLLRPETGVWDKCSWEPCGQLRGNMDKRNPTLRSRHKLMVAICIFLNSAMLAYFRWSTEATQQTVEICWSGSYVKLYPCSPRFGCIPSPVSSTELVWDMMSCIPPHVLLSCASYIVREKERKRHQHLNWINSHSRRSASPSQLPAKCRNQTTIQKSSFRIIQAFRTSLNHV
jgi:hypothetical protein